MDDSNRRALGELPVGKLLIRLSVPAMVGMFVQAFYNLTDAIFVGYFVGHLGIAAVFISFPGVLVAMAVSLGFGIGGTSVISRHLGAQEDELAAGALGGTVAAILAAAVLMAWICLSHGAWFCASLGASPAIADDALAYWKITFGALPVFMPMIAASNFVRGEGNAKLAMYSMIISGVVNIALDPIFIHTLAMGVRGAAVATVISQALALAWLLRFYISGKSVMRLGPRHFRPKAALLWEVMSIGSSAFARQMGFAVSWVVVNRAFAAFGGDSGIATSGVIQRMVSFVTMPVVGIGQGLMPIVGYNFGAKTFSRVREAVRKAGICSIGISVTASALIMSFPAEMLSLFSASPEMLRMGVPGARTVAIGVPFVGVQIVASSFFQGVGRSGVSLFLATLRPMLLFPLLCLLLSRFYQIRGTWAAFPAADIIGTVITLCVYLACARRIHEVPGAPRAEKPREKTD